MSGTPRSTGRSAAADALHIVVLAAFAFAQPVYDLLGRNAEFLVAHDSTRRDILLLVGLLSVAVPAAIALPGLLMARSGRWFHRLAVLVLSMLVLLPVVNRWSGLRGGVALAIGLSLAAAFTLVYERRAPVRAFVTLLSPTVVLFPLLFLFATPVSRLMFPPDLRQASSGARADGPVIVVVFDELSTVRLIDEDRRIDARRFPNLARLASEAHWFRNATTVTDFTVYAVPALLTGRYPSYGKRLPTAGDYPDNLFTLLAGTGPLNVFEPVTALCPAEACANASDIDPQPRLTLLLDTSLVYLNTVVPAGLVDLPSVSGGWRNFAPGWWPAVAGGGEAGTEVASADERLVAFQRFMDRLPVTPGPSLNYMHLLLPHEPLQHLPSGRMYQPFRPTGRVDSADDVWDTDPLAMKTTFERHVLQAQAADRLLGTLIGRLEELGTYDESLLVVAADHGASFRPGTHKRSLEDDNYAEIASVPLLIKLPHQRQGAISDRNVQIIDLLPTVADVIGVTVPWPTDGVSVFDDDRPEPREKLMIKPEWGERRVVESRLSEQLRPDPYVENWATDPEFALYRSGPYAELLGTRADAQAIATHRGSGTVLIDQAAQLAAVDRSTGYVPVYLTGAVALGHMVQPPASLAFAVNGRVAGVAVTIGEGGDRLAFETMIPESVLVEGRNDVAVFLIDGDAEDSVTLVPLDDETPLVPARVERSGAGTAAVRLGSGEAMPMVTGGTAGWVDLVQANGSLLTFEGWAFDRDGHSPAARIVLFVNGEQTHAFSWSTTRPDVARALDDPRAARSGFMFSVPVEQLRAGGGVVEMVAEFPRGVASPLTFDDARRAVLDAAIGRSTAGFRLTSTGDRIAIRDSRGGVHPVEVTGVSGWVDRSVVDDGQVVVEGWAVDPVGKSSPLDLLVFAEDELIYSGGFWVIRPDVADQFGGGADMAVCGYRLTIDRTRVSAIGARPVRFVARFRDGTFRLLATDPFPVEPGP